MWELVRTVIYAVLIALVIRTFAYEPFNIPSGSMIPNLLVGDYLFVSKFAYGYSRFSLPMSPDLFDGRVLEGAPERGDIAVFKKPTDDSTDFIKRIVGLPGDRIQVKGGVLHINDAPVRRERIDDYLNTEFPDFPQRAIRYVETLPGGRSYEIIEAASDRGQYDNTDLYTVPEGHVFAMGDNRDNSTDSRVLSQVGFVPLENLVGRAEIIFFSARCRAFGQRQDCVAHFYEIWKWPWAIRFGRLLKLLG